MKKAFAIIAALSAISVAATDVVQEYPRATLVESELSTDSQPHTFITGPVDKKARDVLFEKSVTVEGTMSWWLFEVPSGPRREDAISFYEQQIDTLGGRTIFSCHGRDCGRATIWAGSVFQVRTLSAPDQNQYYSATAFDIDGRQVLVTLYIVERGNKRIYSYIQQINVEQPVSFGLNQNFAETLARRGIAVIEGVVPDLSGRLDPEVLSLIDAVGDDLNPFRTDSVYVVCHIYGRRSTEELLEASSRCALEVAERIAGRDVVSPTPFGVGPLAPSGVEPKARVELVVPGKLRFD